MAVKRRYSEDLALPKGYLSVSAVDCYLACPYSFYLRYILGIVPDGKIGVALLEGLVGHEVLETAGKEKMEKGQDLPEKQVIEIYDDTFATRKDEAEWKAAEEGPDVVQTRGRTHMRKWTASYAKDQFPIAVEEKVEFMLGDVPVVGYIDQVVQGEAAPLIEDFKFAKSAKTQAEAETGLQFGVYTAAKGIMDVRYTCFTKTKEPEIKRVAGRRTPEANERVKRVFAGVSDAIKKGSFPYCDPTSWKCSKKWCDVWHACPQGGKK